MTDALHILSLVLAKYADADKWKGARFEQIERLSNSHVGSVGQDYIEALRQQADLPCDTPPSAQWPWDLRIDGVAFEVKTATEDVNGKFQFNHLRYHRDYEAALCVGIGPDSVCFGVWSKADVATGKAGRLVSMEKGANASYKLTKAASELTPIDRFESRLREFVAHRKGRAATTAGS